MADDQGTITKETLYDVGGVLMKQPFKAGRIGHFGIFATDVKKSQAFYGDVLGFRCSDSFLANPADPSTQLAFMTFGTDHHALALITSLFAKMDPHYAKGVTLNQISFQVSTLEEVVNANRMQKAKDGDIFRIGRDMPGSNWAVYFRDPDGHLNEVYYGMEQIGWDGLSKPVESSWARFRTNEEPSLPQAAEREEIQAMLDDGGSLSGGNRAIDALPAKYNVGGVLLPRPFKIVRNGAVSLFVEDIDASIAFYANDMGFTKTEEITYKGHRAAFMRSGTEHHCIGLYSKALREELGLNPNTTLMTYSIQVGSYKQLKDSIAYLKENGCTFVDIPPELHPGIDYAVHIVDPDGHTVQLYYYMEQVGWDGTPRPASARRKVSKEWPETLEAMSDTYANVSFQGPLG